MLPTEAQQPSAQQSNPATSPTEEQTVKLWIKRVKDAKLYFDDDYKRMQENMAFAAGIQWEGQLKMDDEGGRYISNIMTNHVNQKVASLYAKDPKCEARTRKRLNYQLWDGSVEQEWQATMAMQQGMMMGMVNPQAQALLMDIQQGKQWEALITRVGKTLEILYGYQCDTQAPSFKYQMKQLVRRVVTTGVGFIRLNYINDFGHMLSSSLTDDSLATRIKTAKAIMGGIEDDNIPDDDPRIEQLRLLLESVQSSIRQGDMTNIEERLEFDFPSATSIIVDPRCKSLKGFIGAEWIAQQYIMPLDAANAYFELRGENAVKGGGEFVQYANDQKALPQPTSEATPKDLAKEPLGCFWEVFELKTKSSFFICDGWKQYVQAPQPLEPSINRFWPIFSLTFNDIEVEMGQKVHIYPPSDVQLLKPMQKERNRTRQELRETREGNRTFHYTMKGWLTDDDRDKLKQHETHELLELQGQPPNGDMEKSLGHWMGSAIDKNMFDVGPLDADAALAVGLNNIQQGGNIRHTAATPAVIQEQSRISGVGSNVDDLDDVLSELAQASGEMMLKKFQPQTVQRIVGKGAAWPDQQREDFLNEVYLDIVAASAGRPNKAVDVQNAMQLGPLMLQAGANPWALIQYYAKVLDANLNPTDFAPVMPPQQPPSGQAPQQKPQGGPNNMHPGNAGQQRGGQPPPPGVQQGGAH